MNRSVVPIVAALLEDSRGRLLLAQRPACKAMPFLWEFPGGKIETGETPEHALVRELHEEIGSTRWKRGRRERTSRVQRKASGASKEPHRSDYHRVLQLPDVDRFQAPRKVSGGGSFVMVHFIDDR